MKRAKLLTAALLLSQVILVNPIQTAQAGYQFTSHTFTSCGISGGDGPTDTNCRAAYVTPWDQENAKFSVSAGIQSWVVPFSGRYYIDALGAGGGDATAGGRGARIADTFELVAGETIRIMVGQRPNVAIPSGGNAGGGGTFVVRTPFNSTASILVVAGGGGGGVGGESRKSTSDAVLTTSGATGAGPNAFYYAAGGTNGSGGSSQNTQDGNTGAGGGGFSGNGAANSNNNVALTRSFTQGGTSGTATSGNAARGGFGGGGSTSSYTGGGGGYSGGGGGGGGSTGGGGGGGSYFANGLNINRITTAAANAAYTNGSVTITSLTPGVISATPRSALTNQSTVTYDVTFSESVTDFTASDITLSGTGSSSCTFGEPTGSGATYVVVLTGCSEGTVNLNIASGAITDGSETGPTINIAGETTTADFTDPLISSVAAPANSTYKATQTPSFTVNFNESVTVTGSPRLTLTVGSLTRYATFTSLTNGKVALFTYTVTNQAGEYDTDGISVSTTLDLNSGVIQDLAGNSLTSLTFTAPTLTSVLVAQLPTPPTIDSITAANASLSVYFTPGSSNGSVITRYQYSTDNGATWRNRAAGTTASPLVLTTTSAAGTTIVNGTNYQIKLRATNVAGDGDSSTAMSGMPSVLAMTGDSTIATTVGQSVSTGTYVASGGTGPYTYALTATPTGVSITNGVVTVSGSTPVGVYTQNIRATDSLSQVGYRQLIITVTKGITTISLSLPDSATTAGLGGVTVISASVSHPGAVNFKLDGTTISGCGAVTVVSLAATCNWTAAVLGSADITAVFTPTSTSTYETSTYLLAIEVVLATPGITVSLPGGVRTAAKGSLITITATVTTAGKIKFLFNGKLIPGCAAKSATTSATCAWKPSVQGSSVKLTAVIKPTSSSFTIGTSAPLNVAITRRTGLR